MVTVFDVERFIDEMKARPALWDTTHADYLCKSKKQTYWLEVARLFNPSFDFLSPGAQWNSVIELQKRWKNLRCCFARELQRKRKQKSSGNEAETWKTYVHYEQMSFLEPFVEHKRVPNGIPIAEEEEENDDCNDISENEDAVAESGNTEESREIPPRLKKKRQANCIREDNLYHVMTQNLRQRVTLEKRLLEDEDKLFMISLAGELKKVPPDAKLELKSDIIHLIQKAQKPSTPQPSSSSNPLNPPSSPLDPPASSDNTSFPDPSYQPVLSNISGQTLHIPYGTFQLILPNVWGQQQSIAHGFRQPVLNPVNAQVMQGPLSYTQPTSRPPCGTFQQSFVQRPQKRSRPNPSPDPFSSPPSNEDRLPFAVTDIRKLYED